MTLYINLAELLGTRIEQGLYRPGDRLPSVRALSLEHGVSLSTVQQAYRHLEDQGLATPKPKSGYFVPQARHQPALPMVSRMAQRPVDVSQWDQVLELISRPPGQEGLLQLGRGRPDIDSPTLKPLLRSLSRLSRRQDATSLTYGCIYGHLGMREQIARLMLDSGCNEALSAAIRAICQPGDIVAVDSPSFHGVMQALKGFGMKALELPTDPLTGISLEALELALEQWPIKAIQLTPTCNNPRPRTIKSYDEDGRVLLCSSFSKTLAPGLRIGWIAPGRYLDRVLHMKYMGTGTTAQLPQLALAEYLEAGHYRPHLRRMRSQYARGLEQMVDWVSRYFPPGTRASRPQGSFMLWVELAPGFDSQRLNRELQPHKIQIAPGSIFSAAGKYRNCLRINYAAKPGAEIEQAVRRVGECVADLLAELD